jgi:hypothetical protein
MRVTVTLDIRDDFVLNYNGDKIDFVVRRFRKIVDYIIKKRFQDIVSGKKNMSDLNSDTMTIRFDYDNTGKSASS